MDDNLSEITRLKQKAIEFRDARNWERYHSLKNLAMGLSIEAAELQELFLWKDDVEASAFLVSEDGRRRVSEELADVMLFVLYIAHAAGIDVSLAVESKIKLNAEKYPVEKCWGSNKKYTEL